MKFHAYFLYKKEANLSNHPFFSATRKFLEQTDKIWHFALLKIYNPIINFFKKLAHTYKLISLMVLKIGLEPTTYALRGRCSTD